MAIISWEEFCKRFAPVVEGYDGPRHYTNGRALDVVLTLARWKRPGVVLEFGTAFGHTAVALAKTCPQAKIVTLDVCQETGGNADSIFKHEILPRARCGEAIASAPEDVQKRITRIIGEPEELRGRVRVQHAEYDFIFIDGDHSWRGVKSDTRWGLWAAKKDAVVVWDDYQTPCPDVIVLVDMMNAKAGNKITLVEGSRVCYLLLDAGTRMAYMEAVAGL